MQTNQAEQNLIEQNAQSSEVVSPEFAESSGKISDACIFVDLSAPALEIWRDALAQSFRDVGISAEETGSGFHVSIAYLDGAVSRDDLEQVAKEIESIASDEHVLPDSFGVLTGVNTPYDYVAIELEPSAWLNEACAVAERQLPIRRFQGGFKAHVSLFRFPKNLLSSDAKTRLIREMNASLNAARALGRRAAWNGKCVTVSSKTREVCCRRPFASLAA